VNKQRGSFARYPYGDSGRACRISDKFATYFRDGPGQDYADQRYYGNAMGRFLTPDPGGTAADTSDPGSWNRYAYVGGDPVNHYDPQGLYRCWVDDDNSNCKGAAGSIGLMGGYTSTYFSNPEGAGYTTGSGTVIGGSGGGGGGAPPKVTSASGALTLLNSTITSLDPQCSKVLPGTDVLLKDAGQLNFFDARASADGNKTVPQIAPALAAYNPTGTLQSIVGGANAVTLNGAKGSISNTILLGNQFFLDDIYGNNANYSVGQTAVLLHELLHYATQLGDDAFVSKYGIQPQQYESSSSAINRWLQNDCRN
jgi:RHS repeat-associated protein